MIGSYPRFSMDSARVSLQNVRWVFITVSETYHLLGV